MSEGTPVAAKGATTPPIDPLEQLAKSLGMAPVQGRFMHGYRADRWQARSNMGIEGTLFSTEVMSLEDPQSFASIRDVPVDALRTWTDVPPLALLPRASNLINAHNVRLARQYGRPVEELE
jgi:hypothetical protein